MKGEEENQGMGSRIVLALRMLGTSMERLHFGLWAYHVRVKWQGILRVEVYSGIK